MTSLSEEQTLLFLTKFRTVSASSELTRNIPSATRNQPRAHADDCVKCNTQATCNTYKRGKMCPFDKCCLFAHGINELRRCPFEHASMKMCVRRVCAFDRQHCAAFRVPFIQRLHSSL